MERREGGSGIGRSASEACSFGVTGEHRDWTALSATRRSPASLIIDIRGTHISEYCKATYRVRANSLLRYDSARSCTLPDRCRCWEVGLSESQRIESTTASQPGGFFSRQSAAPVGASKRHTAVANIPSLNLLQLLQIGSCGVVLKGACSAVSVQN